MPGYGESASPPDPDDPDSLAEAVAVGLDRLFAEPIALAGFSFGGIIAGHAARLRPNLIRHLVLVGSGGLGLPRPALETLKSWRRLKTEEERAEAHRRNLEILMLHDPASVDALALHLQSENTARTRINSPAISRTDTLRRQLYEIGMPVAGIWGEQDATARELVDTRRELLREIDPGAEFVVIPNAGHWAQYEAPGAFNAALDGIVSARRRREPQTPR
jgi:pimeloyl-ACP methyl ester carboxylesterase